MTATVSAMQTVWIARLVASSRGGRCVLGMEGLDMIVTVRSALMHERKGSRSRKGPGMPGPF